MEGREGEQIEIRLGTGGKGGVKRKGVNLQLWHRERQRQVGLCKQHGNSMSTEQGGSDLARLGGVNETEPREIERD